MSPTFLVTHSGGFHADELMSSVILTHLFPEARLVRSREQTWITPAPDRIVYDVGGAYDAGQHIYDHHQRNPPGRADGQPYSSFGLIWKHFGRAYLERSGVPAADVDTVHAAFDAGFVLPVDLMDNGALSPASAGPLLAGMTLPVLLETLKPVYDAGGPEADDRAFHRALGVARAFVEARVAQEAATLRAATVVRAAIERAGASPILELPMGMPYRQAMLAAGADHLLFVVYPRDRDWSVNGIRRSEEGFALRADLPAAWAGLTGADLESASGVPGALFCHNGRFIATAASREAALAMAEAAARAA